MIQTIAIILSVALGLGLFFVGFLFITDADKAFKATEHEPAALTKVMGGRYLGLGAIILGLLLLGNNASLGVAFAVGSFLGFFDGVVTARAGGTARGHYVVGSVSLILAIMFATLSPKMVS